MIAYGDRTFCIAACATTSCPLRMDDSVRRLADRLGLPIAIANLMEGCKEYTPGDQLLICDSCGALHRETPESDSESCECGRFKQRMEYAWR